MAAHRALQNPRPPGKVPCKLVGRLDNPVEPGDVLVKALYVSKDQVAHYALLLGLLGRFIPPTLPIAAQFRVLLHVAFVHEAVATDLAGVPRLATVHVLLVSDKLHPAVKHLITQCAIGLHTMLPPLEVLQFFLQHLKT